MKTAVQQIMFGSCLKDETQALNVLQTLKSAGYSGIELNGFMLQKTPPFVRALTKIAGMPTGKCAQFDWVSLVREANLEVTAIHVDLDTIERDIDAVVLATRLFKTQNIVVSGMYKFDYTNVDKVMRLCERLNAAGEKLEKIGIHLLYHNHNAEFSHYYRVREIGAPECEIAGAETSAQSAGVPECETAGTGEPNIETADRANGSQTPVAATRATSLALNSQPAPAFNAYKCLIQNTNPALVNFEFDAYWTADAGVNPLDIIDALGCRLKLLHITDRGTRTKRAFTPIVKQTSVELGQGNLNIPEILDATQQQKCETVILETHKSWINNNPVKSAQISAEYLNKLEIS